MAHLTFRGVPGAVFMTDGPGRDVELTEQQCNALLDVWEGTDAAQTFNRLYGACEDAKFIPRCSSFRLVSVGLHSAMAHLPDEARP